jgi:hypothetical protein
MEQHLYDRLEGFNKNIPNDYRERWGTALLYLDASHNIAGERMDEVKIYQNYTKYKKNQAIEKASRVSSASVTTAAASKNKTFYDNRRKSAQFSV